MELTKNKNLFIITLDNGKTSTYDFATNKIYGVTGKENKTFNTEVKKALRLYQYNNFIAYYLYQQTLKTPDYYYNPHEWSPSMVETIYSLYNQEYNPRTLIHIADYCNKYNYKLDKKGVKLLNQALKTFKDNESNEMRYFNTYQLNGAITTLQYENKYSSKMQELINNAVSSNNKTNLKTFLEDLDKIAFRYEHENWDLLEYGCSIWDYISKYITLCNQLHKERTYKNLYLSICQLTQEKNLLGDKFCADYQKNAPLFFEDDNLTVVVPTSAQEFQDEANYQQNCVFRMYYPKVRDGQTHVVFIRRKIDINTPFITCEVNNSGEIIQYLTRFNHSVRDEDALIFKNKYETFLHDHFE